MRFIVSAILIVASPGAILAAAPQYKFAFTIIEDSGAPVVVTVAIPPGTRSSLQATSHLTFEVVAPVSVDESAVTLVRLVDDSSGKPVVLHTSHRIGGSTVERAFTYTVCSGRVTFQSPSPRQPMECHN